MTEPDTEGAASEQIEGSPDGGQRRRLLRQGWIIGALLVFGGQVVLLLNLFLRSKAPHAVKGSVDVGPADRFAVGSTTHFWKEGFLLVRHQDA